jgi:hypothetical protein
MAKIDELHRLITDAVADDPRVALIACRRLADEEFASIERKAVRRARQNGWTWARIGRLLGRTRQSVRARFADVDEVAPQRLPDPRPDWDPGAGDRAVARYQRALRLAREFDAYAEDGSDVTPW